MLFTCEGEVVKSLIGVVKWLLILERFRQAERYNTGLYTDS